MHICLRVVYANADANGLENYQSYNKQFDKEKVIYFCVLDFHHATIYCVSLSYNTHIHMPARTHARTPAPNSLAIEPLFFS